MTIDPTRLQQIPDRALDVGALKELFSEIALVHNDVAVRLQLHARPASPYFAQVLVCVEHAVLLVHMPTRTVINVPDLSEVVSFSLDRPFRNFLAFQEYVVTQPHSLKRTHEGLFYA